MLAVSSEQIVPVFIQQLLSSQYGIVGIVAVLIIDAVKSIAGSTAGGLRFGEGCFCNFLNAGVVNNAYLIRSVSCNYGVVPVGARPLPADMISPFHVTFVMDSFYCPFGIVARGVHVLVTLCASYLCHKTILINSCDFQVVLAVVGAFTIGT